MLKRKRKKVQKLPKCPCCGEQRRPTELKVMLKKLLQIEDYDEFKSKRDHITVLTGLRGGWACDVCIRESKALVTDHQAQMYSPFHWPRMAYYDSIKTCRSCGTEFTFSKEEKQHWYEELKFYTWADAVQCLPCRREIRKQKELHKKLAQLLNQGIDNLNEESLDAVIDIYEQWGKTQKVGYYRAVARKLAKKKDRLNNH